MSRPVSLATLKERSLTRADLPLTTTRVDTTPGGYLEQLIQEAAAELYELIAAELPEDYWFEEFAANLTPGDRDWALPTDHYKTIALWWVIDPATSIGPRKPLLLKDFGKEQDFERFGDSWTISSPPRFRERGSAIYFDPAPDQAYRVLLQYVPVMPVIDDTAPTPTPFEGIQGWDIWIDVYVAKILLEADRVDATHLTQELDRLTARVRRNAKRRNQTRKEKVRMTHTPRWRQGTTVSKWRRA
jgi:hypothetical protein